jgi:hypothetical protein
MNKNKFTKREIQILKNNPYTYNVTESQLFFTKDFKEEFWRRYQAGNSPRKIVEDLGYDPDMLGTSRISGIQINIQKQAKSAAGFTEGKGHRKQLESGLYLASENPTDEKIVKMQHELMYLRQEVEFLKKISSLKDTRK